MERAAWQPLGTEKYTTPHMVGDIDLLDTLLQKAEPEGLVDLT
jgi:hypothetical protein